jgi:hypothetical protein
MERDHKSTAAEATTEPAPAPSRQPSETSSGGAPEGTAAGKAASAGSWEADGGLTDAMGLTSGSGGAGAAGAAPTIHRDLKPGGAADASGGDAVDSALADAGKGEAHPSGATIHTDATANAAADELGAAAFTAGTDIYFGAGQHDPGSEQGDALMRHELAHVDQTRGLAPPTPGNYKVSSPDDAAETAATAAESGDGGGAAAEAGTIHTKKTKTADADATDKLQEFFDALAGHNVAEAKTKWGALKAADKARMRKAKVKQYPSSLKADPIESIIEIMGKDGLPIMKETKAAFDKRSYSDAILDDKTHDAAYWMPALKGASLFDDWLGKLPKHSALGESRLAKLDPWMKQASSAADAKRIWVQAYPKLMDKSYDPQWLKTANWGADDTKRMWNAIEGKLPLAHMQTISGGFNLGTHEKFTEKNAAGEYKWTSLGFGWHDPGANVVVMPNSSSTAKGGGSTHSMTGGQDSAGTKEDPNLTHFDSTMLHEIGHGVGDATDGYEFARKHGEWKGKQSWNEWSKHLFDDDAARDALPKHAKKVLAPADARHFLSKEIAGGSFLPAKWKRADVVSFINTHYKAEKLVKYWDNVRTGTPAYEVDANNHAGSRTYVWLERAGLEYTSYKKEIADNKVSLYSLSSTVEWFAEQYSNYYRTGKSGAGADAATKKKLDAIDKMDATKKGGLKKSKSGGADAEGGGESGEAGSGPSHAADDGSKGGGPGAAGDTSGEAFAARIHRMNF